MVKLDLDFAKDFAEGLNYVIEYVIFTLFIYEEAMQVINGSMLMSAYELDRASWHAKHRNYFGWVYPMFVSAFISTGIIALYGCNAYATFLYATCMVEDAGSIVIDNQTLIYEHMGDPLYDSFNW